jgi:hypothetical protein
VNGYRDTEIGRLLGTASEPELSPGFWDVVREHLADEDTGSAGWRSRLSRLRPARRRRTALVAAATVAAVAATAAALWLGLPERTAQVGRGPATASAAVVLARMQSAMARARVLEARYTYSEQGYGGTAAAVWGELEATGTLTLTAEGDARTEGRMTRVVPNGVPLLTGAPREKPGGGPEYPTSWITAYDARRHVESQLWTYRDGTSDALQDTNWLDTARVWPVYVYVIGLADTVRAALAEPGASGAVIVETEYEGRPAWRAAISLDEGIGEQVSVVVDKATGMLMAFTRFVPNWHRDSFALSDVVFDQPVSRDTFTLAFPSRQSVDRTQSDGRVVSVERAAALVGYRPPLPAWVPDGYTLSRVLVGRRYMAATEKETQRPDWVMLEFARGFDRLRVESWPMGLWRGPGVDSITSQAWSLRPVELAGGMFAGGKAQTFLSLSDGEPGLLVHDGKLDVLITGAVTRAEAVAIAESVPAGGSQ